MGPFSFKFIFFVVRQLLKASYMILKNGKADMVTEVHITHSSK